MLPVFVIAMAAKSLQSFICPSTLILIGSLSCNYWNIHYSPLTRLTFYIHKDGIMPRCRVLIRRYIKPEDFQPVRVYFCIDFGWSYLNAWCSL